MSKRLALLFGIMAALFFFARYSGWTGDLRYDPSKPQHLSELRRIIYCAKPLQSALEEYHQQHRGYPEKLEDLTTKEKHYLEEMAGPGRGPRIISLSREGNGYQLYIKLGWDPALHYYSSSDEWIYDPGDGSETTVIEP